MHLLIARGKTGAFATCLKLSHKIKKKMHRMNVLRILLYHEKTLNLLILPKYLQIQIAALREL